jgi:hypothetical protein
VLDSSHFTEQLDSPDSSRNFTSPLQSFRLFERLIPSGVSYLEIGTWMQRDKNERDELPAVAPGQILHEEEKKREGDWREFCRCCGWES